MTSQSIRFITLNTWKCEGNYPQRIRWMAEELERLQPDILLCQEVFQTDDGDICTSAHLAKILRMNHLYEPSRYKSRPFEQAMVMSYSGLAVLSRGQIETHEVIFLPSCPEDPDRIAQLLTLRLGSLRMLVINTHLTHLPHGSQVRRQQLDHILQHIPPDQHYDAIWVGGDFNAEEDSEEIQYFVNQTTWQPTDCFRSFAHHPGYTLVNSQRRIDYIFYLKTERMQAPSITGAAIVLNRKNYQGIFPSDHFGVMINATVYEN